MPPYQIKSVFSNARNQTYLSKCASFNFVQDFLDPFIIGCARSRSGWLVRHAPACVSARNKARWARSVLGLGSWARTGSSVLADSLESEWWDRIGEQLQAQSRSRGKLDLITQVLTILGFYFLNIPRHTQNIMHFARYVRSLWNCFPMTMTVM